MDEQAVISKELSLMANTLLDENAVIAAVTAWLEAKGYRVDSVKAGHPGIDIDAVHSDNNQRWIIEAKGGTSSRVGSKAFGKDYGQNGAYKGTAEAFWMAAHWTSKPQWAEANIGFAIPASKHFDKHSKPLERVCRLLGIAIFRVDPEMKVTVFPPEVEDIGSGRLSRPSVLLS